MFLFVIGAQPPPNKGASGASSKKAATSKQAP
jgi:hypothetical protein